MQALSEQVDEAHRATDRARINRNRAKEAYDRVYLRGARMFEDMCRFAGLDGLAAKIRRRERRAAPEEVVDEQNNIESEISAEESRDDVKDELRSDGPPAAVSLQARDEANQGYEARRTAVRRAKSEIRRVEGPQVAALLPRCRRSDQVDEAHRTGSAEGRTLTAERRSVLPCDNLKFEEQDDEGSDSSRRPSHVR